MAEWKKYADACQKHGTPAIAQICHPGRQSFRVAGRRGIFAPTIAPSAVPVKVGDGILERFIAAVAWTSPREMTHADIEQVIRLFVDTARLMADAGFAGVELHGAHGYLMGMTTPIRSCSCMGDILITGRDFRPILERQGTFPCMIHIN